MGALHEKLLNILQLPIDDYSDKILIPSLQGTPSSEVRECFRESLSAHLFGWPEVTVLRLRLSLADFIWVRSLSHSIAPLSNKLVQKFSAEEKRVTTGQIAQGILNAIAHRTLRTLLRHVKAVASGLTRT